MFPCIPPSADLGCFPWLRRFFSRHKSILFTCNIKSKEWKNPPHKEWSKWLPRVQRQIRIPSPDKSGASLHSPWPCLGGLTAAAHNGLGFAGAAPRGCRAR